MYHFIINPNRLRQWKVWRAIAGYMDRHNIEYDGSDNGIGEARDAARELTKEAGKPCFLIVDGDGTMNEVLDGASFHGPLNLGYIPAETGNDLWRICTCRQARCSA
ncbi:MAG: acylglycerol kinase family protein [Clostridium sp.]